MRRLSTWFREEDPSHRTLAGGALLLLIALAIICLTATLVQIGRRIVFPYDLLVWADDYVLSELLKLRTGEPLYGPYADVNSFVYAPGVPLLHHLLLRPFGLDISLLHNRLLSQAWLVCAVVLGTIASRSIDEQPSMLAGPNRTAFTLLTGLLLLLAGYSNPIADSMHPGNLELVVLSAAAIAAAHWPSLTHRKRLLCALLLPGLAMCAKQTGVSLALAFAAIAMLSGGALRERIQVAVAAAVSIGATLALLQVMTGGTFWQWGFTIPTRQPLEWWRLPLVPKWAWRTISPLLVLLTLAALHVRGRRSDDAFQSGWLRVATIPLAYLPFGMLGYVKTLGGINNFGAPVFFAVILVLPVLRWVFARAEHTAPWLLLVAIAGAQLWLWRPFRRVPTPADYAHGRQICEVITQGMRCGERVMLDQGVACVAHAWMGGLDKSGSPPPGDLARHVPLDRANSWAELVFAGLENATETEQRIESGFYDVIIHHHWNPGYYSESVRETMKDNYKVYRVVPGGQLGGSLWYDGWQNLVDIAFVLERNRDAGRHSAAPNGQCKPAASAAAGGPD
jgi:hypothetical protein